MSRFAPLARLFPHRRVTSRSVLSDLAQTDANPSAKVHEQSQITTREFDNGVLAMNTLPVSVHRLARKRARLRERLLDAHTAVLQAIALAVAFCAQPENSKDLTRVQELDDRLRGDAGEHPRRRLVTVVISRVVGVIILIADVIFFVVMLTDLFGLGVSAQWWERAGILAMSSITPILVTVCAEVIGDRFAETLGEVRTLRRQAESNNALRWGTGTSKVFGASTVAGALGVAILSLFFFSIGRWRFNDLTAGIGAAQADPTLLAMIFGVLPVLAVVSATAAKDPVLREIMAVRRRQKQIRRTANNHISKVMRAVGQHHKAWMDLSDCVRVLLTAGNLAVAHFESLVLRSRAKTGAAGLLAEPPIAQTPWTAHNPMTLVKSKPSQDQEDDHSTLSGGPDDLGEWSIPSLEPIRSTTFPLPSWITTELMLDIEALVKFRPHSHRALLAELARLGELIARPVESSATTGRTSSPMADNVVVRTGDEAAA
jgi:hypothetical protein